MYICKGILTKQECTDILSQLNNWVTGKTNLDKSHKNNWEISGTDLNKYIYAKIVQHPIVKKYSLIEKMCEPRFNKYETGGKYARHVDFFQQKGIRTDWSMTLFLSEPDTYEGGELVIELPGREEAYKLPAGDMVLYPSGNIHSVEPVTKGERIAAIAWAQAFVQDCGERMILCKLIDEIEKTDSVDLSYVYNNLMRKWSSH